MNNKITIMLVTLTFLSGISLAQPSSIEVNPLNPGESGSFIEFHDLHGSPRLPNTPVNEGDISLEEALSTLLTKAMSGFSYVTSKSLSGADYVGNAAWSGGTYIGSKSWDAFSYLAGKGYGILSNVLTDIAIPAAKYSFETIIQAMPDPVKKKTFYYKEGVALGTIGRMIDEGFFYKIFAFDLLRAGGIKAMNVQEDKYFHHTDRLSFTSDDYRIHDELMKHSNSTPFAVRYVEPSDPTGIYAYQYGSGPIASSVSTIDRDFKKTESYEKVGNHYKNSYLTYLWNQGGLLPNAVKSGLIVGVTREGRGLAGPFVWNYCTVLLHEGGSKMVSLKEKSLDTDPKAGAKPSVGKKGKDAMTTVPNVNEYAVYDNTGCNFAEDALLTASEVNIKTTPSFDSGELPDTINEIVITQETLHKKRIVKN